MNKETLERYGEYLMRFWGLPAPGNYIWRNDTELELEEYIARKDVVGDLGRAPYLLK
jgi:hypothetical protein